MPRIRVFDVETTGIDPTEHRVIEIAAYDLDTDANAITRVGSELVAPGRGIPAEASAVHHILEVDLKGAKAFDDAWAVFTQDAPAFFAAHNCDFERGYLNTPAGTQWICTYKCSLRAWPDAPAHGNQVLRYHHKFDEYHGFNRDLASRAHRAEPDAYVTTYLLHKLLTAHSLDELILWTSEPKAYPTISFGKHRGSKWADIPVDYLQWMLAQDTMDVDARHCASLEIKRRSTPNP
jgi:exodeoxyribonuclease X